MAQLAREATRDASFRSFALQFRTIEQADRWIRDHFAYRDEYDEVVRTPQFMLADMGRSDQGRTVQLEGDCDDVATFAAALTKTIGFPSRLVAIRSDRHDPNFDHVFAEAYDGQVWITLDATVPEGTNMQSLEDMAVNI